MRLIATSPTINLRHLSPRDLRAFQAYRQDPEVARYQNWRSMSDDEALHFLRDVSKSKPLAPGRWRQIGIALKKDNTLIGDMGWFLNADQTEVELGITLAREFQNRGHASGAMRMATHHVFASSPVKRVVAWSDVRNLASMRMIQRLGFRHVLTETNDGITEACHHFDRPEPEQA